MIPEQGVNGQPLALRPREAAKALGISPRTLWEWSRRGLVPHAKIGTGKRRVVLYSAAELRGWLARQSEATAQEGGRE